MPFDMDAHLRGRHVFQKGRACDVPYQDMALDVQIMFERIIHHGIHVMEIVFAETGGGRSTLMNGAGISVREGSPFEMMFDDDGVEFGCDGLCVAGGTCFGREIFVVWFDGGDGGAFN